MALKKRPGIKYFGKKVELQEIRFDKDTFFEKNKSKTPITGGALTRVSYDVDGKAITEFQGRKLNNLPDQDVGINAEAMINTGVFVMTPTADRTVSLPTLEEWSVYVNKNLSAFDFTIVNLSTTSKITFTNPDSDISVKGSLVLEAESSVTYRIIVIDADGVTGPEEGFLVNLTQTNAPAPVIPASVVKENNPNVGSWARNRNYIDTSSDDNNPEGIYFKPDGRQMYIIGRQGKDIEQYALSTAWNVSTASKTSEFSNINSGTNLNNPMDIYISPDGVYVYICDDQTNQVARWTMSTPWDITTSSSIQTVSISNADGTPRGVHFSYDGTKCFVTGHQNDRVDRFVLSTPWDLTTLNTTVDQTKALNDIPLLIDVQDGLNTATQPASLRFNDDGTRMVILEQGNHFVYEYTLSTGYDLTTATYATKGPMTRNFDNGPTGIYFNEAAKKAYFVGGQQDWIIEFDTHGPYVDNPGAFWFKNGLTSENDAVFNGAIRTREFYADQHALFQANITNYGASQLTNGNGGVVRILGGTISSGQSNVEIYTNLYWGVNNNTLANTRNHAFNLGYPRSGTELDILIGKFKVSQSSQILPACSGVIRIDSAAESLTHSGTTSLGGTLQVHSNYNYRTLNITGTTKVVDNFTESSDTVITSHTPDTGSGYTEVTNTSSQNINVIGGSGIIKSTGNHNDQTILYTNDTTLNSNNYEAIVTFNRIMNGSRYFFLILRYVDANNYYAIRYNAQYNQIRVYEVISGTTRHVEFSNQGNEFTEAFRYGSANTTNTFVHTLRFRIINNTLMAWLGTGGTEYFRGAWGVGAISGFGKVALGWGNLDSSGGDISNIWEISKLEVKEFTNNLNDLNSTTTNFIKNGNFGVGTTSPTEKLHVNGKIKATDINFSGLPTSASGLSSGDVYNDSGTLKIV